jgi:predicted transport protein
MGDPVAATITQLKNIQTRTGKTIAELHAAVTASDAAKHSERRNWLMQRFKLSYGDANAVALFIDKPLPDLGGGTPTPAAAPADGDPLAAIYTGAKARLRPVHEAVMSKIRAFGEFEESPKKSYVSLRRKKQFAMVGPATKDSIEIGLNAKDLPAHARLKLQPTGSMCNATMRITSAAEVDAQLKGWLRQAYDAAG